MDEEEFISQIRFMFSGEEVEGLLDRMGIVSNDKESEPLEVSDGR